MQKVELMEEIIVLPSNTYQGGACRFIHRQSTMRHSCLLSVDHAGVSSRVYIIWSFFNCLRWLTSNDLRFSTFIVKATLKSSFLPWDNFLQVMGIIGRRVYKTGQTWFQHRIFVSIFNVKHGKEKIMLISYSFEYASSVNASKQEIVIN